MTAKFEFYEVVTVVESTESPPQLWNAEGVVVGKAQDDSGRWEYGVLIPTDNNNCWQLGEGVLRSAGRRLRREDLYDGDSVTVSVQKRDDDREP